MLRNSIQSFIFASMLTYLVKGQESVSFAYRSNSHRNPVLATRNITTEEMANMDLSLPIFVLTHGWLEDMSTDWYEYITDSYFQLMECTIILTDWSASRGLYLLAAFSVKTAGDKIGDFLITLQQYGVNLVNLHMIGFSLGVHVTSNAARRIKSKTNITIGRITALDPAGPLFTIIPEIFNIKVDVEPSDAVIVDALHTSLILGETRQIGTVDFYANGIFLSLQPGCLLLEVCSHLRAPVYYNESILSCGLVATPLFQTGSSVVYGQHMETNATGNYYLQTNSEFPFGQGKRACDTIT